MSEKLAPFCSPEDGRAEPATVRSYGSLASTYNSLFASSKSKHARAESYMSTGCPKSWRPFCSIVRTVPGIPKSRLLARLASVRSAASYVVASRSNTVAQYYYLLTWMRGFIHVLTS